MVPCVTPAQLTSKRQAALSAAAAAGGRASTAPPPLPPRQCAAPQAPRSSHTEQSTAVVAGGHEPSRRQSPGAAGALRRLRFQRLQAPPRQGRMAPRSSRMTWRWCASACCRRCAPSCRPRLTMRKRQREQSAHTSAASTTPYYLTLIAVRGAVTERLRDSPYCPASLPHMRSRASSSSESLCEHAKNSSPSFPCSPASVL